MSTVIVKNVDKATTFSSFFFLSLPPGPLLYYIPTLNKGDRGYLSKGKTIFLDIKVNCCQVVQPSQLLLCMIVEINGSIVN